MSIKYYFLNFFGVFIMVSVFWYLVSFEVYSFYLVILSYVSVALFPFTKKRINNFILVFFSEKFKSGVRDNNNSGRYSFFAIYDLVIYFVSIPVGIIYFLSLFKKRKAK